LLLEYSDRYFAGRLSDYRVRNRRTSHLCGHWDRRRKLITIDLRRCPDGDELRQTLLHEMAHVTAKSDTRASDGGHGPHFLAELARVAALGEPMAELERQKYADTESLYRPTFSSVRNEIEDWVRDTIEPLRWKDVQRTVANRNSLSVRELQRRWPRLRSSFRRIQQEALRWRRRRRRA
jgi:hypothetical protein